LDWSALMDMALKPTSGDDQLAGDERDNLIAGKGGADSLQGGRGADTLIGGTGNDLLNGGEDSDRYVIYRGDGQDVIQDLGLYDQIDEVYFANARSSSVVVAQANFGADLLLTLDTGDSVTLRYAIVDTWFRVETVRFQNGLTWDWAAVFDRSLTATSQADVLMGDERNNAIKGGGGADSLNGGKGSDLLIGDVGDDVLQGGGQSFIYGLDTGSNTLQGGAGRDWLYGAFGADRLEGGADRDFLDGGDGDDWLSGGFGADTLQGNAGADRFAYAQSRDSGVGSASDLISDFAQAAGDRMDMQSLDPGTLAFIGAAAFSGGGQHQVRVQPQGGDQLVQVDLNGDGAADFEIRLVNGGVTDSGAFLL
jgi:Ca2+-binding RTX toxin-like protein